MKKNLVFLLIILSVALFANKTTCQFEGNLSRAYQVGDVVDQDYAWTDSNGENHSIHELTADGKAVVIFWGEDW